MDAIQGEPRTSAQLLGAAEDQDAAHGDAGGRDREPVPDTAKLTHANSAAAIARRSSSVPVISKRRKAVARARLLELHVVTFRYVNSDPRFCGPL
jgi:hypothetical protein